MMQRCFADFRKRFHGIRIVLGISLAIAGFCADSSAQDPAAILEDSLIKIVEKSEAAVVSIARFTISTEEKVRAKTEHRPFKGRTGRTLSEMDLLPNEFGAGTLISPPKSTERLILTNLHVVRGGPVYPKYETDDGRTTLRIHFSDRRDCLGAIIAADPRSDLAVVRPNWEAAGIEPSNFHGLNWESAAPVRKGQFVLLLGNPYAIARDGSPSVSWGIISNLTRQPISLPHSNEFDREENAVKSMLNRLGTMLQLDARLNLGTSGGPVLNLNGELIGVSTSLAAIEGYDQSAGFAFPIDRMTRRIVTTLLAGQEVEYGMIGISPDNVSPQEFARLNTGLIQRSAAKVAHVNEGSPAAVAGLRMDDVIVRVDGETVRSYADLMRLVGLNAPGSYISVTLWRETRRLETVTIKLSKWPVLDDQGIIESNPRYPAWRGLSVDFATSRDRFIPHGQDFDQRCVLVTRVAEHSPGDAAHLQPGNFITHVNRVAVQTPSEFQAAVKDLSGAVSLTLAEMRDGKRVSRVVVVRE